MAEIMLQFSGSVAGPHPLRHQQEDAGRKPEAVGALVNGVHIAPGKRTRLFLRSRAAFSARVGSVFHADPGSAPLLVPRLAEELGGLHGNQEQVMVLSQLEPGGGGLALGKRGPSAGGRSLLPPGQPPRPRTLCMAASHAVACFLLPCASSPAVSFSWATPSAPGAKNCRDMPVIRAAPPGGGRRQAQMPPPGVARCLPAPVQV